MTKTVNKHPIPISNHKFSLMLQTGFKFLRAGVQNENAFMWLEVFPDMPKQQIDFATYGTGQEIPDQAQYLGTYWIGPFVFHLYRL